MPANTIWDSPATLVLLAVAAANLLLPIAHFWPDDREVEPVPPESSAAELAVTSAAGADRSEADPSGEGTAAAAAGAQQDEGSEGSAVPRLAPVITPELAKRVTLHQPAPVCRAWGPFTAPDEAESLAQRLGLPGRDFEIFESEVAASPDYLVTVRAPGGRDAAERVLEELAGRGVDSYVLDRAGAASVLAAGVFSVERRADAQQRRLTELGYEAVVEPLPRAHQVFHLLARLPAATEPEVPPRGACGDIAPLEQFL